MSLIFKYIKRFILGGFLLYAYNIIAVTYNITIPINFFTIITVGLLDFFGLLALVILKIVGL